LALWILAYRMPRYVWYGFVPGGAALLVLAAGLALRGAALLILLYCASLLALGASWLVSRPPWWLKPEWVREDEARGARSVVQEGWDRGLVIAYRIAVVILVLCITVLKVTA
jgi:hypothetical protein